MQVNLAAVGNSTDNTTTSTNATDTDSAESDGAPQMVMVPSPDYMTLEMPPYGQVETFVSLVIFCSIGGQMASAGTKVSGLHQVPRPEHLPQRSP